jgi:hypothetical protein
MVVWLLNMHPSKDTVHQLARNDTPTSLSKTPRRDSQPRYRATESSEAVQYAEVEETINISCVGVDTAENRHKSAYGVESKTLGKLDEAERNSKKAVESHEKFEEPAVVTSFRHNLDYGLEGKGRILAADAIRLSCDANRSRFPDDPVSLYSHICVFAVLLTIYHGWAVSKWCIRSCDLCHGSSVRRTTFPSSAFC